MKVVIVAKTRMGSGACVGALTFDGRSLRLIAADRETNDRYNMDYQVGEVWEIETRPDPEIIPPHVENIIVTNKRRLGPLTQIETFITKQMPPVPGGVEVIFDGLTQRTKIGGLYIAERTGLPQRSTMFWCPDKTLKREDDQKRIRYRYPTPDGGATLTFTGFQEPVPELPAGTLLRVSLAHWWRPKEMEAGEYRCYVQLSGWFLPETPASPCDDQPIQQGKNTYDDKALEIDQVLQKVFGYPDFRPMQAEIIQNLLRKRDTLAVMPTGSGKSLCYQLPATLFPGLTVVVSPLIALMEDQVLELQEWGIPAVYLNSTLSHSEYIETTARLRKGDYKLLYAAPETLLRPESVLLLGDCQADCLVIDEAHCISEWGHDFRPEYRQLAGLRDRLPGAVTLAVTATATYRVRQDIKRSLKITDANEFISSFNRENLVISVTDKISALDQTRKFIDDHHGESGIIYCSTRDGVDNLTKQLRSLDYPVLPYHAGMEDDQRRAHQHRFRFEEGIIMVATIAFGMGINKSNLRFILHYDLPKNIESYYQQIGRAGRDGLTADCLLLFSYSDIHTIRYFISQEPEHLKKVSEMRLQALLKFLDTQNCRRIPLLGYFGERYPAGDGCGACDNCLKIQIPEKQTSRDSDHPKADDVELTTPARQLIRCAQDTREIFGVEHLVKILRGSRAKKVLKFGHEKLPWYGEGQDYSETQWRHMAAQFIRQGLLVRSAPHGSLKVTKAGKTVLGGGKVWGNLPGTLTRAATRESPEHDAELFERLRAVRTRLAQERSLPPYVIFHDRSLIEMATYFPHTSAELMQVYGIGQRKASEYGPYFLPIIRSYCQENQIQPSSRQSQQPVVGPRNRSQRTEYVWERHKAGDSIEKIARDLDLKPSTILNHLKKAHQAGKPLRVEILKKSSQLSPQDEVQVISAFDELGYIYLRPVFDMLEERISFDQLHLWRVIYDVMSIEK